MDQLIVQLDQGLRTSLGRAHERRPSPAQGVDDEPLDERERRHAAGLMRINHTGEVCAQALYYGQALTARDAGTHEHMLEAAADETDHLAWCEQRLERLGSRPSLLNPVWYLGSFTIGAVAGAAGDDWSLGFVAETERQVEAHLEGHLRSLPEGDRQDRAVVAQMAEDEARHAADARKAGARELPMPVRRAMRLSADLMKWVAYRL